MNSNSKSKRRQFSAETKLQILKEGREAKLQAAAAARRAYWQQHPAQEARRLS